MNKKKGESITRNINTKKENSQTKQKETEPLSESLIFDDQEGKTPNKAPKASGSTFSPLIAEIVLKTSFQYLYKDGQSQKTWIRSADGC